MLTVPDEDKMDGILQHSPNYKMNKQVLDRFLVLEQPVEVCQVTYVWIDGTGQNIRSKDKTVYFVPTDHTRKSYFTNAIS